MYRQWFAEDGGHLITTSVKHARAQALLATHCRGAPVTEDAEKCSPVVVFALGLIKAHQYGIRPIRARAALSQLLGIHRRGDCRITARFVEAGRLAGSRNATCGTQAGMTWCRRAMANCHCHCGSRLASPLPNSNPLTESPRWTSSV